MEPFFSFMASSIGRLTRIAAGAALILVGLLIVQGFWGWVLGIVGLVPMLAGFFDVCVFAPLAGLPFVGSRLRQELDQE